MRKKLNYSHRNLWHKLNKFWVFLQERSGSVFETSFYVSKGSFSWKILVQEKNITFSSDICRNFPKFSKNFFCRAVKICIVRVNGNILTKFVPARPDVVSILFGICDNLRENDWNFCFHFRTLMQIFLEIFGAKFMQVWRYSNLGVHMIVFIRTNVFEKKNTFQNVFHILGGNFSGFQQKFPRTVLRNALVSKFLNRTYASFFRTSRKISLAGLSELHSTCPQVCFHGKHLVWRKKPFSVCISLFRRKLFRFSAKFFQHGNQNWLDF